MHVFTAPINITRSSHRKSQVATNMVLWSTVCADLWPNLGAVNIWVIVPFCFKSGSVAYQTRLVSPWVIGLTASCWKMNHGYTNSPGRSSSRTVGSQKNGKLRIGRVSCLISSGVKRFCFYLTGQKKAQTYGLRIKVFSFSTVDPNSSKS